MAKTPEEKAAEKAAKDAEKAAAAEAKAAEKAAKANATEATVVWKQGERTFTKEVHGEDFADLAAQFAAKFGGEVK